MLLVSKSPQPTPNSIKKKIASGSDFVPTTIPTPRSAGMIAAIPRALT